MLEIVPEFEALADDTDRFVPIQLSRRAAERARRLAVPREAVEAAPGWMLALLAVPDEEVWTEAGKRLEIDIRVHGETAHVRTVWPALETLLHQAEPRVLIDDLDTDLLAALIETHCISQIEALEAVLGSAVTVEGVNKCRNHAALAHLDLSLRVSGSPDPYPAAVFASPRVLGLLATAWERRPRRPSAVPEPAFLFAARVATSSVSRAGLRGLAVGDALLFDRVAPDGGIALCLGEHLVATGQITENGSVILGVPFAASSPFSLGEFLMLDDDSETDSGAAALDEASIDNLPVRLIFEVGRREMSLDELRGLGVGASISLDKAASSVVDILANGRRIGAGEMVLIGDQLGVRITRLNTHA